MSGQDQLIIFGFGQEGDDGGRKESLAF